MIPGRGELALDVSFLVDPGADVTTLVPLDGIRAGIDYSKLTTKQEIGGIGGVTELFVEPAVAIFAEDATSLHGFVIRVLIVPPSDEMMDVPSLVGRDVLDNWRMTYSPTEGQLSFNVKYSDFTVDIAVAFGDDNSDPLVLHE